jgi:hypothetical protein
MTTPAAAPIHLLDCLATLGDDGSHGLLQYGGRTFYRAGAAVVIPAAPSLLDLLGLDASPAAIAVTVTPPAAMTAPASGAYTTPAWTASSPTAGVTWTWAFVGGTPTGATINATGNTATVTIADVAALGVGPHDIDLAATATLGGTTGVGSGTATVTVPLPPITAVVVGTWADLTGTLTSYGWHTAQIAGPAAGSAVPASPGINNIPLDGVYWTTVLLSADMVLTVALRGTHAQNAFVAVQVDGKGPYQTAAAKSFAVSAGTSGPESVWTWDVVGGFAAHAVGDNVPVAMV